MQMTKCAVDAKTGMGWIVDYGIWIYGSVAENFACHSQKI